VKLPGTAARKPQGNGRATPHFPQAGVPNFRRIVGQNVGPIGGLPFKRRQRNRMLAVAIRCHGCGRTGSLIWESEMRPSRTPIMANLVSLSEDFYLVVPKSYRGDLEVVCAHCGAVQIGITDRNPAHKIL
jgi:hypothetical protein